jgi:hypothetical protein
LTGTVDIVPFTTTNGGPQNLGELAWLASTESLALRLKNGENLDIGEETIYHVDNNTGSTIAKGTAVSYAGTVGGSGKIRVKPWDGITDAPEAFMGLAMGSIANNATGYVTSFGQVRGVNTSAFSDGAILYANPSGTGLTAMKPTTTHVIACLCVNASNNGTILVRPTVAGYVETTDSRLTDAREWTADTITQVEAEAGTSTTRRAFTAQRVFQAIAAWWNASAFKTKLDGIATGATANQTDAYLLARANHTGTQDIGTVTGSRSGIDSRTSFPNADISAATSAPTPNTLVRRDSGASASFGNVSALDIVAQGNIYTATDETVVGVYGASSVIEADGPNSSIRTNHPNSNITTRGSFVLNGGTNAITLLGTPTANRTIIVPDASGTLVLDTDSRLTDARTPLAHTHGNISNDGAIGTTPNLVVTTTTGGVLTTTDRSGIDSRTSFPNDDVTAATLDPTANTIVKRGSLGESYFDLVIGGTQTNGASMSSGGVTFYTNDVISTLQVDPSVAGSRSYTLPDASGTLAMASDPVRTTLTGNGSTSTYAISGATGLTNPSALIVAIDGVLQEPNVDYTVSGGNITFTDPLANGAKAVVISPTNTIQVGQVTPSDGSVTSAKIAAGVTLTSPTINSATLTNSTLNTPTLSGIPNFAATNYTYGAGAALAHRTALSVQRIHPALDDGQQNDWLEVQGGRISTMLVIGTYSNVQYAHQIGPFLAGQTITVLQPTTAGIINRPQFNGRLDLNAIHTGAFNANGVGVWFPQITGIPANLLNMGVDGATKQIWSWRITLPTLANRLGRVYSVFTGMTRGVSNNGNMPNTGTTGYVRFAFDGADNALKCYITTATNTTVTQTTTGALPSPVVGNFFAYSMSDATREFYVRGILASTPSRSVTLQIRPVGSAIWTTVAVITSGDLGFTYAGLNVSADGSATGASVSENNCLSVHEAHYAAIYTV